VALPPLSIIGFDLSYSMSIFLIVLQESVLIYVAITKVLIKKRHVFRMEGYGFSSLSWDM
jgi:hypothetical protein